MLSILEKPEEGSHPCHQGEGYSSTHNPAHGLIHLPLLASFWLELLYINLWRMRRTGTVFRLFICRVHFTLSRRPRQHNPDLCILCTSGWSSTQRARSATSDRRDSSLPLLFSKFNPIIVHAIHKAKDVPDHVSQSRLCCQSRGSRHKNKAGFHRIPPIWII